MADFIKITGNLPDGSPVNLNIDGASTQRQMERLIKLVAEMTDRLTKGKSDTAKQEKADKEHLDNTQDLNKAQTETLKTGKKTKEQTEEFQKALTDLRYGAMDLQGGFKSMFHGIGKFDVLAAAAGSLTGSVMNMADTVGMGLQRGVSGGIMDFAIAAKTAGVDTATFSKALEESGGAFASLGDGASIGAKNFGALVGEVRNATAGVGNMGLSLDQMAMFTAQQTKVAVAQGFKGKQAQDVIIRNSRELGNELDTLASRTGKSVLELAQSAMKLAQDPIVASFVKSAGAGAKYVSQSIQSLGASFKALFGEAGDQMAGDLAKSALGGLPFAVTQTGKNMILASSTVYNEMDRQAQIAKAGGKLTEKDQEQLRATVLEEVRQRGDQLRMMANLEGPAGDSARQILAMATAADNYNSEENKRARKQDETAKAFNASVRNMQANLQALAIPFMNLINGVDWTFFIDILNGFVKVVEVLLTPLTLMGKLIGDTGAGSIIGALLALGTAGILVHAGFNSLVKGIKTLNTVINGFVNSKASPSPNEFVGPLQPGKTEPNRTGAENKGYELGKAYAKFSSVINGMTVALAGSALAIWGESRLREDENDILGNFLVTVGKGAEILGAFGGLIFQFLPQITAAMPLVVSSLGALANTVIGVAGTLLPALGGLAVAAWTAAAPFLPLIAAVTALIGVGYLIYDNWESIVEAGKNIIDFVLTPFKLLGDGIMKIWDWLKSSVLGKLFGGGDSGRGTTSTASTTQSRGNSGWNSIPAGATVVDENGNRRPATVDEVNAAKAGQRAAGASTAYPTDQSTTTSNVLPETAAKANEANSAKESESQKQAQKQTALLEEVVAANNAQVNIQARGVSVQDSSNRYLRQTSMATQ